MIITNIDIIQSFLIEVAQLDSLLFDAAMRNGGFLRRWRRSFVQHALPHSGWNCRTAAASVVLTTALRYLVLKLKVIIYIKGSN